MKEQNTMTNEEQLRNERDEARRMYCSEVDNTRPHGIYAEDIAKSMGWDCYKQEETAK